MTDATDIEAFVAVARAGSFTRAAAALGTSKSNVGKAVQRLEERLGAQLFQRTTRVVRLTEDGATYLAAARAALEGLREAEQTLAGRRAEPSGRVRIDLPAGLGRLVLPSFTAFRKRHPKVTLEISLDDRLSDPVAEGWDIVVRIGRLPAGGAALARKLCDLRLGLYASPAYLARRGPPRTIDAIHEHDAIVFRGPSGRLRPWSVGERELVPSPAVLLSDGQAIVDAAVGGLGLAQIFDRIAAPWVTSKHLVQVLPEADVAGPPVHALVPLGRRMAPKTRAVLAHLAATL